MTNVKKRLFALFLAVFMILSALPAFTVSVDAEDVGMTFDTAKTADVWRMRKRFGDDQLPYTISTWIKVPTDIGDDRVGGIISNYDGGYTPDTYYKNETYGNRAILFEIHKNGYPRFYYGTDKDGYGTLGKDALIFDQVDVRTGEWMHLTVVKESNAVILYVNGTEAQRLETSAVYHPDVLLQPFAFGGDNRASNSYPFKGSMKSLTVYTSPLTSAQVSALYTNGVDTTNTSILLNYDLTTAPTGDYIADLSGNNFYAAKSTYVSPVESENNVVIGERGTGTAGKTESESEEDTETDYAYSFAVVGDTQYMTRFDAAFDRTHLHYVYDWLLDNVEEKKIKYVFGLGDITDSYNKTGTYSTEKEWELAYAQISRLNGVVPYSVVRGNHDNEVWMDRYFANDAAYKSLFNDPDLEDQSDCFYKDGSILSAYTKFTVGETKYMLVILDDNANDDILNWANKAIARNPDHRVIITTHTYLGYNGNHIEDTEFWAYANHNLEEGENTGAQIWEKCVSQHRNIFLVLCGHDYKVGGNLVTVQREGVHGNIVTEMIVDPQALDKNEDIEDKNGAVAMLYFSEDGKDVRVEYISTIKTAQSTTGEDVYNNAAKNNFSFNLISHDASIDCIELIKSEGLVDTYACWLTNGLCSLFNVTNGKDGVNGKDGMDGQDGMDGVDGINGTNGRDGLNGTDGKDGAAGSTVIVSTAIASTALATDVGVIAYMIIKKSRGIV